MKNIFKSLMLVAVAAMAFTACQKDNDETNKTEQKTVITGVATIENDDTRSTFLPKEDGETAYQSAWEGNETLKVYYNDTSYPGAILNSEGQFKAEIDGTLPDTYYITICSPADSWLSIYSPKIPTEQTPHVNSVDPAAHILQAQNVWVKNGSAEADLQHFIAYGKMTVSTPVAFDIDHVIVEFNGLKYDYDSTMSYRINADNVENNVFWFGCDILDVDNFIVTAYDAEGNSYSKTVENVTTLPKPLKFQQGRVSTFSISLTTYAEKPAEPTVPTYNAASISYSSGQDKVVNFASSDVNLKELVINFYNCFLINDSDAVLREDTYKYGSSNIYPTDSGGMNSYDGTDIYEITVIVSHVDEGYHLVFENVKDGNGNMLLERATYTGTIEGLTASWATGGNESNATEVKILSHMDLYKQDGEHQIAFVYNAEKKYHFSVDFLSLPIVAKTYTWTDGLSGSYCFKQDDETIYAKDCKAIVTANDDGSLTFDVTITLKNDEVYHFVYTATV